MGSWIVLYPAAHIFSVRFEPSAEYPGPEARGFIHGKEKNEAGCTRPPIVMFENPRLEAVISWVGTVIHR